MKPSEALRRNRTYGLVLALVVASAAFQVAAPQTIWARLVIVCLQAATLAACVWVAHSHKAVVLAAGAVVLAALVASLVLASVGAPLPAPVAAVTSGLFVGCAAAVIVDGLVRGLRAEAGVALETLAGVLAIYLLMGMFYSFVYGAVDALEAGRFFATEADPTRSDFLYFSYVTLSTVGFGDLTPVTDVGRMLTLTEALVGQIYLVTIVALIVTNLRSRRG
jgi:hypothetical protein